MKTKAHTTLPTPVTDELQRVGLALRRARVARGESQAALADRLGVSERTLREAEKGDPGVAVGTLFGLLWAVGLSGTGAELIRRVDGNTAPVTNLRARRGKALDDF
ncbi:MULTISPECIES: helix-turn-helix transcriptional regulator [Hydrocarboniphaga]|uniref:HTH cro/C1-type domain-containing protein n=1 Tax=Hydrocarboniphaga effusa AP103 TaxID=1172194 RepID=I8T237_9GAMM|nr:MULTISPECIES: helix-turn-helix domain-containing protein [Hydrocarboniphaga]EIT67955.1 hypothetical protein WQQ_43900 [Hydrocarboniphaga effusa AP103]MDZ4076985.1 helix-turn-helix domain-containing protein [Hydrocarboniphaga sp.]